MRSKREFAVRWMVALTFIVCVANLAEAGRPAGGGIVNPSQKYLSWGVGQQAPAPSMYRAPVPPQKNPVQQRPVQSQYVVQAQNPVHPTTVPPSPGGQPVVPPAPTSTSSQAPATTYENPPTPITPIETRAPSVYGSSVITFVNYSGEPALVRVVGPTRGEVSVPNGMQNSIYDVAPGRYLIYVRYGTPGSYRYSEGDTFEVQGSSTTYSKVTITLHTVAAGNYSVHGSSEAAFAGAAP